MSDERRPVKPLDLSEKTDGDACARCGAKEDLLRYEHHEDHFYCRPCWERVETQQRMIEEDLEDEPSLE
jgi:recombinational DNA repair protein (RecF pathway)